MFPPPPPAKPEEQKAVGVPPEKNTAIAVKPAEGKANLPPQPSGPPPEFFPGSNPRPAPWKRWWPELGGLALLATFAYYALVESGKGARHDSPKFVDALNIWYPLVIARQPTPRAVKRWMNRVRYLATQELPVSELRSRIERFADWYAARGETAYFSPSNFAKEGTEQSQPGRIPEEIAVALAAIQEFDAKAIKTPANFQALKSANTTAGLSTPGEKATEVIPPKRTPHTNEKNFK